MSVNQIFEEYGARVQNYLLVWVDQSFDGRKDKRYKQFIEELRAVGNKLVVCNNFTQGIRYLEKIENEQIFVLCSGRMIREIAPRVEQMAQVNSVYVFCGDRSAHEEWATQWSKIRGVFTNFRELCDKLNSNVQECERNMTAISWITANDGASSRHSKPIDPAFAFAQVLKESLANIDLPKSSTQDLIKYCKSALDENTIQLKLIERFKREYQGNKAISWYMAPSFLSTMLNRALRTMQVNSIMTLGFFIRDLQDSINRLYLEQQTGRDDKKPITAYRCQSLSSTDYERLMKMTGELITFNSFFMASENPKVTEKFFKKTKSNRQFLPVLFIFHIDPSKSSTPFADISSCTNQQIDEEILFSLPSIFRIEQVREKQPYSEVALALVADEDTQLAALLEQVQEETFPSLYGWYRLGNLLMKLDQWKRAEQLYKTLHNQTSERLERAKIQHTLGTIMQKQGQQQEAVQHYEQSIEEKKKILSETHPDLLDSTHSLSQLYEAMGNYAQALVCMRTVLDAQKQILPPNHPDMAASYSAIGTILFKLTVHDKALSAHEGAYAIYQRTLPASHIQLASCCHNMGQAHLKMCRFEKAISLFQQAIEIGENSSLTNPQDLEQWKKDLEVAKASFENSSTDIDRDEIHV